MIRIFTLCLILLAPYHAFAHGDQPLNPATLVGASGDILSLMQNIHENPSLQGGDSSDAMNRLHHIIVATEDQIAHYAERLEKDSPDRAIRLKSAADQFFAQVNTFHKALHDEDMETAQQALTRAVSANKLLVVFLK